MLMGLGQSDSEHVTQTEYDVTAYRNVLDQLNTLEGTLNEAMRPIKGQLLLTLTEKTDSRDHKKLSGFMMKHKGGKHPARWSQVVGPIVGVKLDHGGYAGSGSRHGGREPERARNRLKKLFGSGAVSSTRRCEHIGGR